MDYNLYNIYGMSSFIARGYGVSQGNKTQMQICEKQIESPDLREIIWLLRTI
jgi:hypothetical protein